MLVRKGWIKDVVQHSWGSAAVFHSRCKWQGNFTEVAL